MSALVTAAEAQALLDAAPAGPYEACHPDDLPGRSIIMGGRECRPPYDVFVVGIEDRPRVALAELFAAAPDLARTVIAQAAEIATLRAAYAQDLDGLRAELRRADDERAAWRERVEAAERETLRLRSLLPAVAFIRCPTCGTDRDAELDDDAVYVMRRHPRRTTRDGYDEMMWCDGGVVSEVKR